MQLRVKGQWWSKSRTPRSRPSWLSLRPAGSPEAAFSARACLRPPQAPARLGLGFSRLGCALAWPATCLAFDRGAHSCRSPSSATLAAAGRYGRCGTWGLGLGLGLGSGAAGFRGTMCLLRSRRRRRCAPGRAAASGRARRASRGCAAGCL
eukprot:scaffold32566_cov60-Phaeocystis_antarctica.AAC.8